MPEKKRSLIRTSKLSADPNRPRPTIEEQHRIRRKMFKMLDETDFRAISKVKKIKPKKKPLKKK